ncbi:MAG: hypothetical protein AAF193_10600, partial [Bacteroidota bacterium]
GIAQTDTTYTQFEYPDGTVSSEGNLVGGQPEGYWRTYYPDGTLKSEGDRLNFQLTGEWKFYRENGELQEIINYQSGQRNGITASYDDEGRLTSEVPYFDDLKQGVGKFYYTSGELYREVPFENNKEQGKGREFGKDGRIITYINYNQGYIKSIERINRFNGAGQKKGVWIDFWANGNKQTEGYFTNGVKNGVFKYYNKRGELEKIEKYQGGVLLTDADEAALLEIKKEYYEDGKIKLIGSYRDGSKQGVFREYNKEGEIQKSFVYQENVLLGEGIVDAEGRRQGEWILYYSTGEIRAKGEYIDGLKEGPWIYFFENGKTSQKGKYKRDLATGDWTWFYVNGETHREEGYRKGREDGHFVEYDEEGKVIHEGDYIDGLKTGPWFYHVNDHKEEGEYLDGE